MSQIIKRKMTDAMKNDRTATEPAGGTPVDRPVGRMEPEREAFEHWCAANGHGALTMRNVLADMALEAEAATALAMRLARAFDQRADEQQALLARVLTMLMDRALKNLLWSAWQAADARWNAALLQTWQMVDPLKPAGQPGSYWRGQDAGIVAALTTLSENLKTPNAADKPTGAAFCARSA